VHVSFPEMLLELSATAGHKHAQPLKDLFGEDQTPLEAEVVLELVKPFWTEEPYLSQGVIIEGFPRDDEDVRVLTEAGLFPDVTVVMTLDGTIGTRRALPKLYKAFTKERDGEVARRKKKADEKAKAAKEKFDTWTKVQVEKKEAKQAARELEKATQRAEQGDAYESAEEDEDEEEEEEYPEEEEEEEEEEELEDPEEAKGRIEEEIGEKQDAAGEGATAAGELFMEEYKVPMVELNADLREASVRKMFDTALGPWTGRLRKNIFEYTRATSGEEARAKIGNGSLFLSQFGTWCPVSLKEGTAVQPILGAQYPATHRGVVYMMSSAENRKKFLLDPLGYIQQSKPPPALPVNVAVVGPPKSGKTMIAERLSASYGCKVITVESAVQDLLAESPASALSNAVRAHVEAASTVPFDLCIKAVAKALQSPEVQTSGYVLDGHPFSKAELEMLEAEGIVPRKIIELTCPETDCLARAADLREETAQDDNRELHDSDQILGVRGAAYLTGLSSVKRFCQSNRQNWGVVDGSRSKWWVGTAVEELVAAQMQQQQQYWVEKIGGRPAKIDGICLSPAEVNARLGAHGLFCPVTLTKAHRLVKTGLDDFANTLEYRNLFYKLSSASAADLFCADPDAFVGAALPAKLPARITAEEVKAAFPTPIEFGGYCPVTYVAGRNQYSALKEGGGEGCAVEYDSKIFMMMDSDAVEEFMQIPTKYCNLVLPKKLPPKVRPIAVNKLPMLGYLEQTVALTITKSMSACGLAKPKFPFMTPEQSAMVYTGLHMKATNPRATEYTRSVYRTKLKRFVEKCELVMYLGKSMSDSHADSRPLGFDGKLSEFLRIQKTAQLNAAN